MSNHVELVTESLRPSTLREFDRRVEEQAAALTDDCRSGRLDNPSFAVGIELEVYAVDEHDRLVRIPTAVFGDHCDKELGRHNAEFQTDPEPFDDDGITSQAAQLRRRFRHVQRAAADDDVRVVLDAMWTVPPPEGSVEYLSAVDEVDGVTIAANMTPSPRYYAIDNAVVDRAGGSVTFSVPGVSREFPSILVESLTSSIQPHIQVPTVEAFPRYHNLAIRTLAPVLALSTNSPLLPVDLYDVDDPRRLLDETYHELRIPVFEQSINGAWRKVRFPDDIDATTDVVDNLVADPTCAPFLREWVVEGEDRESFADRYWELDHKRGTYWRWLRAVTGGQPVGGGDEWSIRIEYRPIPTQPTVVDNIGVQCLVSGLVRGLAVADHPLDELDREAARTSFYDVVESGLDAELAWVTADGDRTADRDVIYGEIFELARLGLGEQGVSGETIETYLRPIEARWARRTTPSRWKLSWVRRGIEAGQTFEKSVSGMQSAYLRRSGDGPPFSTWPDEP